ncbi:hypothetical protein ASG93_21540 [Paenibacillus sp. Soil787]|nr:hypothetical protein ASG93_21540 [Paenibacillus sp. Soil787]
MMVPQLMSNKHGHLHEGKERRGIPICFQILDYPPLDLATSSLDKPQPKGAYFTKNGIDVRRLLR